MNLHPVLGSTKKAVVASVIALNAALPVPPQGPSKKRPWRSIKGLTGKQFRADQRQARADRRNLAVKS